MYYLLSLLLKFFYWLIPVASDKKDLISQILLKHNDYRRRNNLPALKLNHTLCLAADEHAKFMCQKGHLSHKNFNKRVIDLGIKCENVGLGGDLDTVFDMWIKSSGHKRNILDNVSEAGFACYDGYWVALFS